ncbi:MAG: HK97 family phage prohead protease [Rhodospirillales bacterium]|nr:HK97 family phage prohead protease [Rhodospirillales bacterium]
MKHRTTVPFELKALDGGEAEGSFEGYGSVFNVEDLGRDVVAPGAFRNTLAESEREGRWPRMLWMHQSDEPIGVWREMREDARGLYVRGQLATGTQRGREALELMRLGAVDGLSIGYAAVEASTDDVTGIRVITEARLFEVSPVVFPMNTEARVTGVKTSAGFSQLSEREFERFLRDAGLPKSFATAVTLHGFKQASAALRDAGGGLAVPRSDPRDAGGAENLLRALRDMRRAIETPE